MAIIKCLINNKTYHYYVTLYTYFEINKMGTVPSNYHASVRITLNTSTYWLN